MPAQPLVPTARASTTRIPGAFVLGALLWAGLAGVAAWVPLVPGEPVPLRWLRKLEEHPVRGTLALGLLVLALRKAPGRPRTPLPGSTRALGEGIGGYGSFGGPPEATISRPQGRFDPSGDRSGDRPEGP